MACPEVSEPAEVVLVVMPAHTQPVVHGLHDQVNILERFQLQHRKTSIPRGPKQIDIPRSPDENAGTCV